MTKSTDDLEAVRIVAEALQGFDASDQERIIRWAREKLGLVASATPQIPAPSEPMPSPAAFDRPTPPAAPTPKNLEIVAQPAVEVSEVEEPAVHQSVVEQPEVEQAKPAEERSEVVDVLAPASEHKNKTFLVVGIIFLIVAVALLIAMIVSFRK